MKALIKKAGDSLDDYKDRLGDEGVEVFSSHKRLGVPKDKVSKSDLKDQGFKPDYFAVPEPGQSSLKSWRDEEGYHLHDHGDQWIMHQDAHSAAYFNPKEGLSHLKSEGLPGLAKAVTWPIRKGKTSLSEEIEHLKN